MRSCALPLVTALILTLAGCNRNKVEHPNLTPTSTPHRPQLTQPIPTLKNPTPVVLKILSPREGEAISAKGPTTTVRVTFSLSGYELQSDGQHLLVFLDNNPYEIYDDLSTPFTFKNPLPPGLHTIRAFPAGGPMTEGVSLHESLKEESAFAMTSFTVGKLDPKQEPKSPVKPGDPLLTFSRPQGEYIGEKTKKIMLDFWLQNALLGADAYKVKYTVNGGSAVTLTEWKKTFLEGLPLGENVIELWLVGPDGERVPGAFNRVSRKITLKESAAKSLFERLGGQAALEAVVRDLLLSLSKDEALNKRFAKANIKRLQEQLIAQLCEVTGGPCKQASNSMRVYDRLKLSDKESQAFMRHLARALEMNQLLEKEQREVLAALRSKRPQLPTE
jgi:truncated hemoglobin YjbI